MAKVTEAIAKTDRVYADRPAEQGLTVDNLGSENAPLRRANAAREAFAKTANAVREAQGDITDGEVAVQRLNEVKELSPGQELLLLKLKGRYERNEHNIKCHNEIEWARVEAKLRANPAKLKALNKMELSGGEPDVAYTDAGDFIFCDLSKSAPTGRRNVTYYQARDRARAMGAGTELMSIGEYTYIGNNLKIVMDVGVEWVWLETGQDVLKYRLAHYGVRQLPRAKILKGSINLHTRDGAFRCSLRV